jgi:putative oxidoreductase
MSFRQGAGLYERNGVQRITGREATMTASSVTPGPTTQRAGARNIALWTAQILLAVFFAFAAAGKLFGDPTSVAMFNDIGFGQWFRYLTGACELAGAIGLLIPRLSGLAALGLAGVMVGATLTNLFLLPGVAPFAVLTVLLGVVFVLIARARWPQTRALLATLSR